MPRLRACAAVLAVVGAAFLTTFVTSAGASRAPTSVERAALTNAVHASSVGGINRIPRSRYRVAAQRVSSVSNSWATAQLVATPTDRASFQNVVVVAVRPAGTQRWVVVDLGSAEVGCGIAPNKVLADLFTTNRPCALGGIG